MKSTFRHIITTTVLSIALANIATAQFQDADDVPKTNSPLTSFGLGTIQPLGTGTIDSYGGLYATFQDPYAINIVNPASLTSLTQMAFETGVYIQNSTFKQNNVKESALTGNLDYIAIAFPTKNLSNELFAVKRSTFKHGMSLSLSPYSVVGYDILDESGSVDGSPVSDSFKGKGGTYRFMWGNGVKYKNLSFGINIGYLFGNIEQQRSLTLPNSDLAYASIFYDKINIRGSQWNAGLQYNLMLKKKKKRDDGSDLPPDQLILGVYGNSATDITTITDRIVSRGIPNFGSFISLDTLQNTAEVRTPGRMPAEFGFGAMYYKTDPNTNISKLKAGFNFSTTSWSQFVLDGRDANMRDGWTFGAGAEWIPRENSLKYYQTIRYRIGLKIAKDPRFVGNDQLRNSALQIGVGLPVIFRESYDKGKKSFINLSLELGTLNSNSIDETYGRIGVGFTLNDSRWFLKRKLN